MDLKKELKLHLIVFYLCGLIPYPLDRNESKIFAFSQHIPVFLGSLVNIFIYVRAIQIETEMETTINLLFAIFFSTSIMITNLVLSIQCICFRQTFYQLIEQFLIVEIKLKKHYTINLQVKLFKRHLRTKAILIFSTLLLITINLCFLNPDEVNVFLVFILNIYSIVSFMEIIAIVFFVDLLKLNIVKISETLSNNKLIVKNLYENTDSLDALKNVYMDLYKLVECINNYFGWALVSLLLKSFIDVTYDIYWLYEIYNIGTILVFRKFPFLNYN